MVAAMSAIFSSASKLVFLMIAVTLCAGLFAGKISQDNFIYLAASVFSYYFGLAVGTTTQTPGQPTPMPLQPGEEPERVTAIPVAAPPAAVQGQK